MTTTSAHYTRVQANVASATCGLFIALFIRLASVSEWESGTRHTRYSATHAFDISEIFLYFTFLSCCLCAPCRTCFSCTPHFTRIDANKRRKRAKISRERERERDRYIGKTRHKTANCISSDLCGRGTTNSTILRNKIFYNWVGTHNQWVRCMWLNARSINLCTRHAPLSAWQAAC